MHWWTCFGNIRASSGGLIADIEKSRGERRLHNNYKNYIAHKYFYETTVYLDILIRNRGKLCLQKILR